MDNEVKISAHYRLTVADYLEAQQLYNQKSKVSFGNFFLLPVLTFLLLVEIYRLKDPSFLVFFSSSYEYTNDELWTYIVVFSIIYWLSFSTLFPKFDPLSWWSTSKRYQKNFVQQESKQITISVTGVNITSQNYRESRAWEDVDRVLENKKIFLLCNSRSEECTIIPKRIFDDEAEIKNFHDLLTKAKSYELEAKKK